MPRRAFKRPAKLPAASIARLPEPSAFSKLMHKAADNARLASELGAFAQVLVPPSVSHREIVVCYSDVRGFTSYCDAMQRSSSQKKIHNFLSNLFPVFAQGVLMRLMDLETGSTSMRKPDPMDVEARRFLRPTSWKTLGDGIVLVWELDGVSNMATAGLVAMDIMSTVNLMSAFFSHRFRNLTPQEKDGFSDEVTKLRLGFGLARGHALRLDFPGWPVPDYAGNIMNLGSRLVNLARPEGTVAHIDVSRPMFQSFSKDKYGKIVRIRDVKGFDAGVEVWASDEVIIPSEKLAT